MSTIIEPVNKAGIIILDTELEFNEFSEFTELIFNDLTFKDLTPYLTNLKDTDPTLIAVPEIGKIFFGTFEDEMWIKKDDGEIKYFTSENDFVLGDIDCGEY